MAQGGGIGGDPHVAVLQLHRLKDAGLEEVDVGGQARAPVACRRMGGRGEGGGWPGRKVGLFVWGARRGLAGGQVHSTQNEARQARQAGRGHPSRATAKTPRPQPQRSPTHPPTNDEMHGGVGGAVCCRAALAAAAEDGAGALVGVVVPMPGGVHLCAIAREEGARQGAEGVRQAGRSAS